MANDDSEEATARLEEALERIARLAKRTETAEVAARLDVLIAQLRTALVAPSA